MRPDPFDGPLSAVHNHVENLAVWLAIWVNRHEPDAHARRCAADTIDAIDGALIDLHAIRAELVHQVRAADDQAAARADELLAKTRDGPPLPHHWPGGHRQKPEATSSRSKASAASVDRGGDSGPAPREATP